MIFQITDDLIDVEGSAETTGKRTQKDAARGKLTYPGCWVLRKAAAMPENWQPRPSNIYGLLALPPTG